VRGCPRRVGAVAHRHPMSAARTNNWPNAHHQTRCPIELLPWTDCGTLLKVLLRSKSSSLGPLPLIAPKRQCVESDSGPPLLPGALHRLTPQKCSSLASVYSPISGDGGHIQGWDCTMYDSARWPRLVTRAVTIAAILGVLLPASAAASRPATDGTRTAIERVVAPAFAFAVPQRCLLVLVTTKDGGNWGTVGFNLHNLHSCARWAFNGVAIAHHVGGRWQYLGGGSADIPCGRLGIPVAVRLDLRLPCAATGSSQPGQGHQPVYFFLNVAAIIKAPGQPVEKEVIRPSTLDLFADGSWYLQNLRWTGWGSKVAHANGISSASNGNPSQAQGKRIETPAQITLSHPGLFLGRTVYRCYQLTVPPPATDLHGCLTGHNGYWSMLP
jgi:hypothetical protein